MFTLWVNQLSFKHTKKGYKIQPWKIAIGSIVISVILGGLFFKELLVKDLPL